MFLAAAGKPSFWYHLVLVLHLLCIIGGFGYLAFSGVFFAGVRRQGDASLAAALAVNRSLSQLAELLLIAAFVFGILHGWIRRSQRRYVSVASALPKTAKGEAAPPEVAQLDALERAISAGWGVFNLVVVAAVVLTVFQPGK